MFWHALGILLFQKHGVMKIFAAHYENDFTSTTKVFGQLIKGWVNAGKEVVVVRGSGENGWLSDLEGTTTMKMGKIFHGSKFKQLARFFFRQFVFFIRLLIKIKSEDLVYINTLTPFGAAVAGKLKGARVIYHLHEASSRPLVLESFLFYIMSKTVDEVVYSSNHLAVHEKLENKNIHILYNALDSQLVEKARFSRLEKVVSKNVLMVSSLNLENGIFEYLELARRHEHRYNFKLVLVSSPQLVKQYFDRETLPSNLEIIVADKDISRYYDWADVVLGLSKPNCWVDTFGIYIVEGMAFGLPAIVPTSDTIDIIEENENGFLIDSSNLDEISAKLALLFDNEKEYKRMSESAKSHVSFYNDDKLFIGKSVEILAI